MAINLQNLSRPAPLEYGDKVTIAGQTLVFKYKENADLREELTETKRLLARWIDDRPYTVSEQKDLIADTEQFLKECE